MDLSKTNFDTFSLFMVSTKSGGLWLHTTIGFALSVADGSTMGFCSLPIFCSG